MLGGVLGIDSPGVLALGTKAQAATSPVYLIPVTARALLSLPVQALASPSIPVRAVAVLTIPVTTPVQPGG